MKKKITAALLCAVMVLSLAGCNSNNEEPDDDDDKPKKDKSSYSEDVNSTEDSKPDESKPDESKPEDSSSTESKPTESSSTKSSKGSSTASKSTESKPEEKPVETVDWSTVPYAEELDFMVEDVEGGVKITQYLGKEKLIKIPQTIGGKTVVELSNLGYDTLSSGMIGINIPNSVTKIAQSSFWSCEGLKSVVLPDSYVTSSYAFLSKCPSENTVYTFLGKTYRMPEDKIVLQDALYPGTGKMWIRDDGELTKVSIAIKDVVIPSNVTKIRSNTFQNCDLIEDITIPGNVTKVDGSIFNNCPNLKSVTFAEGVTSIGVDKKVLFTDCPKLETINLPESLTEIKGYGLVGSAIGVPIEPKDLQVTYKGVTYKSNQLPNLYKAVNGN